MNSNIILTEPNQDKRRSDETNNKRLKYLIKENTQLKEQIKDLKSMLEINRETLSCMTQSSTVKKSSNGLSFLKKGHQDTFSTNISRGNGGEDYQGEDKGRMELVNALINENRLLALSLDRAIEERNTAQNKLYLNERIVQQNLEFEEEMVKDYNEKIENLKTSIKTKECILHEFECLRMIPADSELEPNVYLIYKEVTAPNKLINSVINERKHIETELIEERMANSKIRKHYKNLLTQANVSYYSLVHKDRVVKAQKHSPIKVRLQRLEPGRHKFRHLQRSSHSVQVTSEELKPTESNQGRHASGCEGDQLHA
jgi:hypothetical protein